MHIHTIYIIHKHQNKLGKLHQFFLTYFTKKPTRFWLKSRDNKEIYIASTKVCTTVRADEAFHIDFKCNYNSVTQQPYNLHSCIEPETNMPPCLENILENYN